jgi:hypothetical protein
VARILYHYTDKDGYDAIRSAPEWRFLATQPRAKHHPPGAYFTDYPPDTVGLAVKLMIPTRKLAYVFAFSAAEQDDLRPIRGDRGEHIVYAPQDYVVPRDRQVAHGPVEK